MEHISIIVPVYKAEKYIEACVDSILAQTYQDFELILVDDGSPDRSGQICEELAAADSRIRVLHKENGGAATARNAGLDVAAGQYIAFVDGDDCIHPQYLEFLLALLNREQADVAMCHYDFFTEDGDWFHENLHLETAVAQRTVLEGPVLLSEFTKHCRKVSLISLCMKLYKRQIFDGLRIPEGYIEEDSLVLPYVLERAKRIAKSDLKMYHWRETPGSVTRSGLTAKSFAYIEVSRSQAEFFSQRGQRDVADHFKKEFLQRTLKYYFRICDERPELMQDFKFHIQRYRKLFVRYFMAKSMCVRERTAYILFWMNPKSARKLYEQVYGGEQI